MCQLSTHSALLPNELVPHDSVKAPEKYISKSKNTDAMTIPQRKHCIISPIIFTKQ